MLCVVSKPGQLRRESRLAIAFDSEGRESIELSDAYKADEMQGSVLLQLAQELVLVANGYQPRAERFVQDLHLTPSLANC